MLTSDQTLSFVVAATLHLLGLLWVGNLEPRAAAADATEPALETASVELSLPSIEDESDAAQPAAEPQEERAEPLEVPRPADPPPPPVLLDKPTFAEALAPPPEPAPAAAESTPAPAKPLPAAPATPSAEATAPVSGGSDAEATIRPAAGSQGRVDAYPSLDRPIKPSYPIGARRRGEEGSVILDVSVGADGRARTVTRVSSSGFPDLDAAAERAAALACFKPATRDKQPVDSLARITIIFRLRDQ